MRLAGRASAREEAQELMWDAMDIVYDDDQKASRLCRKALEVYPDCVDAITMLAEIECEQTTDYVERLRTAVEAGRRDLGEKCFKVNAGHFWGLIETRPFMRAISQLAFALLDCSAPELLDEAIEAFEEMLTLNPDDNLGVRDPLVACYLARKRYANACNLLANYKDDWLTTPFWARVLLAYATEGESAATLALEEARERNAHVEDYLAGRKRRPRTRAGSYSPGDVNEALFCADTLWEAWKKHPKAKRWLKTMCDADAKN